MAHAEKRWRLVCYDVRAPKRYRRVYKTLKGTGYPVQYSVFRCRLDDRELERLRWELARILHDNDRLLVITLCPSCAGRVASRGHIADWEEVEPSFRCVPAATGTDQASPRVGLPERAPARAKRRGCRKRSPTAVEGA